MTTFKCFFATVGDDIGKVVGVSGDLAEIEFFEAPVPGGMITRSVAISDLRRVILERQTRIWWNDEGQWRIGRILEPPDQNTENYLIALPNQQNAELPPGEFSVRGPSRLDDPVGLIAARTADARFFQRNRSAFMREMLKHRAAAEGLTGISSSCIQLHAHQVNAARRVLHDPVRRYLLADEVGLGKTIEAGMVIRQTLLDEMNARVLVLVPDALVAQWENELTEKFDVTGLNGGWVDVRPHASVLEEPTRYGDSLALLVIDEAHRLTGADSHPAVYECVANLAGATPALLLLSATPVRSNEDTFLRLLHLLDPIAYRLEDLDAFRRRIAERDNIGNAVGLLAEDTPAFLLTEAADVLSTTFPDDAELSDMLKRLRAATLVDDEASIRAEVRQVKHYVSDTYRVHRRLIRTRRNERLQAEFPVRRRGRSELWRLVDPDLRRRHVVEALDRFRGRLGAEEDLPVSDVLRVVAARCSAAVPAVIGLARALEGDESDLLPHELRPIAALREHQLGESLGEWLEEAVSDEAKVDGRLDAMADWAWSKTGKYKVAACSSYTSVARKAYERMRERYGAHRVAALLSDMSPAERERQYDHAREDRECVLLVCDIVAEEGWNLQFVREVLHLDVPWSVNRLEQRLGRFDRFAVGVGTNEPVLSTVVADVGELDRLCGSWIRLLDEGFEVFTRSSATLQYVLPQHEDAAIKRAVDTGFGALAADLESEHADLQELRRHIEGQDILDAIDDSEEGNRFFQQLVDTDRSAGRLDEAVSNWIGKALNFSERFDDETRVRRFGISKRNPPLLPESEIRRIGLHHFDESYTARRKGCGRDGAHLLRPGQPLLDSIFELCLRDDRGKAFAGELEVRGLPDEQSPTPVFFFDFLITPMLDPSAFLEPAKRLALQGVALKLLPDVMESVWLVPGVGEPPEEMQGQLKKERTTDLGNDVVRFEKLTDRFDWPTTCRMAEDDAIRRVRSRSVLHERMTRARTLVDREQARELARAAMRAEALGEPFDAAEIEMGYELLRAAIAAPNVHTDSCGVVLLTRPTE